ncbi:MAG: HPF/RaiA family ribosome-associated protein [Planctomycetota bacterium]|nr:HPF/RaiA family ribosome-associated protein [Planctomycetota bacterium]
MQIPLEITFRDMPHSDAIEEEIRTRAERLDRFYDKITRCRVAVLAPHSRQRKGQLYEVHIDLTVPGKELVINHAGHEDAHEDPRIAVRDAFEAATRRLQDYVRERRGHTKQHEQPAHGRVARLFAEEGYGFLETPDGREIYFHRNSVLHRGFDALELGAEVRFSEEEGRKGPQASSVRPVGGHAYQE